MSKVLVGKKNMQIRYLWSPAGLDVPVSVYDAVANSTCYYHTDAKKNITELTNASGSVVAHYEYSPFGKVVVSTGTYANTNPFRFSSEYHDDETGLVYYNYRYYSPELGRWLSRDPIEEQGGVNLYGMCHNGSFNLFDYYGVVYKLGDKEPPHITWDDGFRYNPNEKATIKNKMDHIKYIILLKGAQLLGHLPDATKAYEHYLSNKGTDLIVNYYKFYEEDNLGKMTINEDLLLAVRTVESLHKEAGSDSFKISGDPFIVKGTSINTFLTKIPIVSV